MPASERDDDRPGAPAGTGGTATRDEAYAEPVDDGGAGEASEDAAATLQRAAAALDPERAVAALESDESVGLRALRMVVSSAAVFGFVAAFGAGAGAAVVLLKVVVAAAGLSRAAADVGGRLVLLGAMLLPAATFLFVAWYDDATLRRPRWPGGHPPLGDAWLFAMLAYGLATIALLDASWPDALVTGGLLSGLAGAYLVLPVWLGWRCLAEESWVLGVLAGLTGLLVPIAVVTGYAVLSQGVLYEEPRTPVAVAGALTVAVLGVGLPFAFARWSPGPTPLARLVAGGLARLAAVARSTGRRLREAV